MGKKLWRRKRNMVMAWLLVWTMVFTGPGLPAGSIRAAETVTVTDAANASGPVYVELKAEDTIAADAWGAGSPKEELTQYSVTLYNHSSETISDWKIEIAVSDASSWNRGWNGAKQEGNKVVISTYKNAEWDNMEIPAGSSVSGPGFQIATSVMKDAAVTITYNKGASSGIPGEEETGSGSGSSGGDGAVQGDTTTDLDLNLEYNYAKLLQYSLYFYDANMCGELEGKCALDWRKNCHTYDKKVDYKGKTVDVSGGFHDAGDHDKFGLPQGYAASILGMGYYEYKDAYEKTGQTEHFKTILDYFCDYFVRCTVLDDRGEAEAFCYQVGDGSDHSLWMAAEDETISRPAYFADASKPATDQVSEAAAALAIHYVNFGDEKYLDCAKKLFAMEKNISNKAVRNSENGEFYKSSSWEDDYCLAAAWLYQATKDAAYKDEYNKYKDKINVYGWPSWDQVGAYAKAYGEDDFGQFAINVDNTLNGTKKVDNGYAWLAQWGSARYNANMQLEGLICDKHTNKDSYTSWAEGQMKFLLGNNTAKRCYVVGYNANSSKYPHHRTASGYGVIPNAGNEYEHAVQKHVLLGALVGGIESADGTYHDSAADYTCNEVAIDYNAAFTGAAAALYLLHEKESGQYTVPLSEIPGVIDDGSENPLPKDPDTEEETNPPKPGTEEETNPPKPGTEGETNPPKPGTEGETDSPKPGTEGETDSPKPGTEGETNPSDTGTGSVGTGSGNSGNGGIVNSGTGAEADQKANPAGIRITGPKKVAKKKKVILTASVLPQAANQTVTWSSGKTKIATVNQKGVVQGKKPGRVVITAKTVNGITKSFPMQVMRKAVKKIKLKAKKTLKVNRTVKIKVSFTPKKQISKDLLWTSSNPAVATVNAKGQVKTKKKGKVRITAKATDGSKKKKTIRITVK